MTGESLKPVLPRNHTAPSGRRLSELLDLYCIVHVLYYTNCTFWTWYIHWYIGTLVLIDFTHPTV